MTLVGGAMGSDRLLLAATFGFFVLTSTIPPVWYEVGPFEKDECERINSAMRVTRIYLDIDPCEEW